MAKTKEPPTPKADDVLRRMLATPPAPFTPKAPPTKSSAKKKPR